MSHLSDKQSALMGLEFAMDTLYRHEMDKLQSELQEAKQCLRGLLKMRENELQLVINYKKLSLIFFAVVWLFFPDAVFVYGLWVICAFPEIASCTPPYFL